MLHFYLTLINLLNVDVNTPLTSVNAATEIGTWWNENNRKRSRYLKLIELRCSLRKCRVNYVGGMRKGNRNTCRCGHLNLRATCKMAG